MATQHRYMSSTEETGDVMPALESVTSSSEDERDPYPQQNPPTGGRFEFSSLIVLSAISPSVTGLPDVFYCQEPLQQFLQRTYPRPSFLDQLLDNDPSLSISPHSTAGQDGGDESQGRGERGTDEVWEILGCEVDDFGVSIFLIRIHRKLKLGYPGAHTLIDGLEPVSKGLLTRYQAVRGKDGVLCDVCHESLDFDSSYDAGDQDPLEPIQTENKELLLALPYYSAIPEVVALPCSHPFHSECLLPWFAQKTTCPKCRFDVDPDSLVLRDGSAQRPWVPPATGVLEAWVKAEEEKVASGLNIGVAL